MGGGARFLVVGLLGMTDRPDVGSGGLLAFEEETTRMAR
jgi:hypothetical protein